MEAIILYVVVMLVIFGFVAAFTYAAHLSYKDGFNDVGASETDSEWGPPGIGKTYPVCTPEEYLAGQGYQIGVPDAAIEYTSAYDPYNTVKFDDPADAYEYVIGAVAFKNRALDRLESAVYLGDPVDYEYLLRDIHLERGYWLAELHEYREDA